MLNMKDKQGNQLTFKKFMKRWKQGIEGITPIQQTKMQIQSMYIILFGISMGIVVSIINIKSLWWMLIILIGGYFNVTINILSTVQKLKLLKNFDKLTLEIEEVKNV